MTTCNPDAHHRQSHRLRAIDYSSPGAYFVTICVQNRLNLFGEVLEGRMRLNDAGEMVQHKWLEMPASFDHLRLEGFVIMPNHVHLIAVLDESRRGEHRVRPYEQGVSLPDRRGDLHDRPTDAPIPRDVEPQHPTGTKDRTLGRIIQLFKTVTTQAYIRGVHNHRWTPFQKRLWQRDYWDRVLRDEDELNGRRTYILENPLRWALDELNPVAEVL